MEKSSTSPVANVISNGDKRSCSHTLGERGKRRFAGLESLGPKPAFSPLGHVHLLSAWKTGRVKWHGLIMGWRACLYLGKARVWGRKLVSA